MKSPIALSFCVLAALAACHSDDSSQQARPKPAVHAAATAASQRGVKELTAGMVEAVSQGKSPGPMSLKFDLLGRPTVGQPLDIAIALLPQVPAAPASIEIAPGDGLQLSGKGQIDFPAVEAAQVYRETVKVTPTAEGVQFITVHVGMHHDDIDDSREFSVPVIVGASFAAAAGPPSTAAVPPANAVSVANQAR